ncbi:MAG: peptidoglycan editing factor PgeF [Lachnospiraceae bacterium]|nr:peptidoglycan editing factor PgeF [Lachnospiraceae bacterium]
MASAGFLRKERKEPGFKIRENYKGDVCYLTFPVFDALKGFTHGFSTRLGGVSEGMFASMNLTSSRGDDREKVLENYRRLSEAGGFLLDSVVTSDQTHTTNVRIVTEKDRGSGVTKKRDFHDTDGMITNVPDVTLMIYFADCVPLLFIDPVKRAIGLSHSGWKGTVGKMGLQTVRLMEKTYGCDPGDIYAAIGPSICRDCYEVSEDVAERFREAFSEEITEKILFKKEDAQGKYLLDLWEANRQIMLEAGINPDRIEVTDICTCCNPNLLFSHRASNGKRGNMGAFLKIDLPAGT